MPGAGARLASMTDHITLTGVVATTPRSLRTSEGLAITSFRLASAQRRYDRVAGTWSDGETNWYTVTCFRALAENAAASVGKGERVLVTGRLRVRPWESGEKSGTSVEVDADALGHDLLWGRTQFTRSTAAAAAPGAETPAPDAAEADHVADTAQETPAAPGTPVAPAVGSDASAADAPAEVGTPTAEAWSPVEAEPVF